MTKKVFVSLPMNGRDIDDIRADMRNLFDMLKSGILELGDEAELIDTIWTDEPDDDIVNEGVWYLGKSIKALSEADVVIFHPGWREARGCIIEHMVCALYNIPYFDVSLEYAGSDGDDTIDNTHDWDFAGQVNATLSEEVAKAEDLDDILDDEDVEDALGFEHDDVDDLVDSDPDLNPDIL